MTIAVLVGFWELYRRIWTSAGWTWPFEVNDTSMPDVWTILQAFAEPAQVNQPALATILWHKTLFTAKEAAFGFALGAHRRVRARRRPRAVARCFSAASCPTSSASQTIPILAIAPMVVIWVNPKLPGPLQGWGAVAVIAAYLTFFPVAINTLRGLAVGRPARARADAVVRRGRLARALEGARSDARSRTSSRRSKIAATASVVGAIIGELPSGLQSGLGGAILNFNQYYSIEPQKLWATNIVAARSESPSS